ncbi:DM13 domain-containing protein [Paenarthrobacter nitroguajacolicus]|uniref:DM13 domain-containing protein n=1 Tax=Paenarthrobacter nitroguajacolicus TaxID=211146 RepID=UPI000A85F75A|nr:DM13 domain-containing protein [Paenarthrobacter nitroguajacolicus]
MNTLWSMTRFRRLVRAHRILAAVAGLVILSAVVAGAALFQPWRLFTSSTLNEALPAAPFSAISEPADRPAVPGSPPPASSGPAAPAPTPPVPAAPLVLSSGAFQSQEHETTGTAQLVKLADGSHLLRLENLASSDGPDVKVWLSSLEAGGDWFKYRSGRYVDLGAIKATHGNHNYAIPAGTDVAGLTSVVLWCDRFSVAFGSAPLS